MSSQEIQAFIANRLLSRFVEAIGEYKSNVDISKRLEVLVSNLSPGDRNPLFTIDEMTFTSALVSPWEEINRVYIYLYRRVDAESASPAIMMPDFIEVSPMTRAVALLLIDTGWTVLEVTMPFYGRRIVSKIRPRDLLSERYAALELTPRDFCGYIEQAVEDIRRAALWLSRLPFVDAEHIAIWGFSFAASVGLTAYATNATLTHAIGICPPIDWAHAIWTAPDQEPYLTFLKSIKVTQGQFRGIVSPFQPDHVPPRNERIHQSKIFYVRKDPYTVAGVIESVTERLAMLPPFAADGSGHEHPHMTGLLPYFASIVENTVDLIARK